MAVSRRQKKLEKYVRKYFVKHPEVKLVVVSGSIGKTTAKTAIATILSERYRVRLFHGNRSSGAIGPLAILGINYPGEIKGWRAWHAVYKAARKRIKDPTDVDMIIHELNTPYPGSVAEYATYLRPNIAVVTSVSANNLEQFQTLEAVAAEQLAVVNISETALINRDEVVGEFAKYLTNPAINTFGTGGAAEYRFSEDDFAPESGYKGEFIALEWGEPIPASVKVFDEFSLQLTTVAAAIGVKYGLTSAEITTGLSKIRASKGRTNILRGIKHSLILDDTANTSPLGATSALRALYQLSAPQRIAVFADMKHLGTASAAEHTALGNLCDSTQLAWVVTVGEEAGKYIAPAAKQRGCQVYSAKNALEAGTFVHSVIEESSAVLFNGPDEGVYLEEAIKIVLHATEDAPDQLVRQSPEWVEKKAAFFSHFS